MTSHGKALVLATEKALIVVGTPFGSYEQSPQMAFRRAAWIMKETGSGAIKLEGGLWMADTIRFLVKRGILLMAHIGLTPQSSHVMGALKFKAAKWIAGQSMRSMLGRFAPPETLPLFSRGWWRVGT